MPLSQDAHTLLRYLKKAFREPVSPGDLRVLNDVVNGAGEVTKTGHDRTCNALAELADQSLTVEWDSPDGPLVIVAAGLESSEQAAPWYIDPAQLEWIEARETADLDEPFRPYLILGSTMVNFSPVGPDACGGKTLRRQEYCICCERWGGDVS